jgi:hypothetical protein
VRNFDGSDVVIDRDMTLQVRLNFAGSLLGLPVRLHYDVEPVVDSGVGRLWAPSIIPGLVETGNDDSREATLATATETTRDYFIDADDEEIEPGVELEFVLEVGPVFAARLIDPADPRTVAPWVLSIGDIIEQRSGVTILNNVIYPDRGDKTVITYETSRAGIATVQVFTLDGSLVSVLHRGRQAVGIHTYAWDGRNMNGAPVARGIYFVRVVAPGIDEYRKVLVARD